MYTHAMQHLTNIYSIIHEDCCKNIFRGGSRAAATSKMECLVIIVKGFRTLTIITKHSILDVAAVLDPSLISNCGIFTDILRSCLSISLVPGVH